MKRTLCGFALFAALSTLLLASESRAGFEYGFNNITNNNATNVAVGKAQAGLDVSSYGTNQVKFFFTNIGLAAAAISNIYFDEPTALFTTATTIQNGTSTSFYKPTTPTNMTGGSAIGFVADKQIAAYTPVTTNGINPGESLGVVLTLASGKVFNDVITALQTSALRVGIRMQGFSAAGGESFINKPTSSTPPPPVVPEPSGLVLASLAAVGLAVSRKFRKP